MSDLKVLHIVRRYGLVGGMEGYVWELTNALAVLGVKVEVVCEQICTPPSSEIKIHKVTRDTSPFRWKAMLGFRTRVNDLIEQMFDSRKIIIHSHERSINHQITTFHGPPMIVKAGWWRFSWLNARIKAWKIMERSEVLGPRVICVLPVSNQIKRQLVSLHPLIEKNHVIVAYPGVHEFLGRNSSIKPKSTGPRFIFVGKEWKRKGLMFAIEVIERVSSLFYPCTMDIYGPEASELPTAVTRNPRLIVKGWSTNIQWQKYDTLIHPATSEPFGMIIPEARSHGVPVLTTNLVGSVELDFHGVTALDSPENVEEWADALVQLSQSEDKKKPEIRWTWQQLAMQHINEIYPLVTDLLENVSKSKS